MSYIFREFRPETDTDKPFDCGVPDLNGFFRERDTKEPNATNCALEHMSVTYVVQDESSGEIEAYFSLLNDSIERHRVDSSIWNHLSRRIPNKKRRSTYPALKIGRLAVTNSAKHSGMGRTIIAFIQGWFFTKPISGCRFLTVDALRSVEEFYVKCDFSRLATPVRNNKTVPMYFDLMTLQLH